MPVRVLIVDDSPVIRAIMKSVLRQDPEIEVVGEAGDPYEAREAIKRLNPDVITLDVEMPRMSGVEFLKKIMQLRPMPVVMVSSLTAAGSEKAIDALAIGAVDCIGKPVGGDTPNPFYELPAILKNAARASTHVQYADQKAVQREAYNPSDKVVLIGASTGGVDALFRILRSFPANCPPTMIVQHMPSGFTASFASRLNQHCAPAVMEATHGAMLRPGHVYIAPGGTRHLEVSGKRYPACLLVDGPPVSGHSPSVDRLFTTGAVLGERVVGVLLTGMGRDGADGLKTIREQGGYTIAQSEATCVVYGMPRVAAEIGAVKIQLPLNMIAAEALKAAGEWITA